MKTTKEGRQPKNEDDLKYGNYPKNEDILKKENDWK